VPFLLSNNPLCIIELLKIITTISCISTASVVSENNNSKLKDPDDVLLQAEQRKKEIAEHERMMKGEQPAPPETNM
jgi:hypothetical protein